MSCKVITTKNRSFALRRAFVQPTGDFQRLRGTAAVGVVPAKVRHKRLQFLVGDFNSTMVVHSSAVNHQPYAFRLATD